MNEGIEFEYEDILKERRYRPESLERRVRKLKLTAVKKRPHKIAIPLIVLALCLSGFAAIFLVAEGPDQNARASAVADHIVVWRYNVRDGPDANSAYISGSDNPWAYDRYIFLAFYLGVIPTASALTDVKLHINCNGYVGSATPAAVNATNAITMTNSTAHLYSQAQMAAISDAGHNPWDFAVISTGWKLSNGFDSRWQTQFNTNKTIYLGVSAWDFVGTVISDSFYFKAGNVPYINVTYTAPAVWSPPAGGINPTIHQYGPNYNASAGYVAHDNNWDDYPYYVIASFDLGDYPAYGFTFTRVNVSALITYNNTDPGYYWLDVNATDAFGGANGSVSRSAAQIEGIYETDTDVFRIYQVGVGYPDETIYVWFTGEATTGLDKWQGQYDTNQTIYIGFSGISAEPAYKGSYGIKGANITLNFSYEVVTGYPEIIRPIIDVSGKSQWYASSGTNRSAMVDELDVGSDEDATYDWSGGGGWQDFRMEQIDSAPGYQITNLTIWLIAKKNTYITSTLYSQVWNTPTPSGWHKFTPTSSYVNYSWKMTICPWTGQAWTWQNVNAIYMDNYAYYVRVSQIAILVNWTAIPPGQWAPEILSDPEYDSTGYEWYQGFWWQYDMETNETAVWDVDSIYGEFLAVNYYLGFPSVYCRLEGYLPTSTEFSITIYLNISATSDTGHLNDWQNFTITAEGAAFSYILRPDGDITEHWTPSEGSDNYAMLNEMNRDNDVTYVEEPDGTGTMDIYSMSDFYTTEGQVYTLTLWTWAKGDGAVFGTGLYQEEQEYPTYLVPTYTGTAAYANYTGAARVYTECPWTEEPWDQSTINDVQVALGGLTIGTRVTQIAILITYTITDESPPVADADGPYSVVVSHSFTLDGSGSTDNIGISYYNWTIHYTSNMTLAWSSNGVTETRAGPATLPIDNYTVYLNCTDAAGNYDNDSTTLRIVATLPLSDSVLYLRWLGSEGVMLIIGGLGFFGMIFTPFIYLRRREGGGQGLVLAIGWWFLWFGLFVAAVMVSS